MSATALERSTQMEIEARRVMIFDTMKGMEEMILVTAQPDLDAVPPPQGAE